MAALQVGAATDVGLVRTVNEDRFLVDEALFAVADGLGGHQAGEVASKTAVETLSREFHQPTVDGLVEAAKAANRAVYQLASDQPELQGMATTLTAVALVEADGERRLAVANVGDSRAYLLQRGEMMQLTEDHSLVEQLVREGRLTAQEALVHPQRSVITRALGLDPDVEVDSWQILPYEGDRLLLCSDGLTNEVSDSDIAAILRRTDDPEDAARQLVDRARTHGGNDNITVVVIDVVDDEGRAEKASAALASEGGRATDRATGGTTTPAPPAFSPTPAAGDPVGRGGQTQTAVRPPPSGPAPPPAPATGRAGSGLSWRMVLFVFGLVAVLAVAASAVGWYARSTYYVGLQGDRVVIFKGRPGGLLWFAPTVEQRTRLRDSDVPASRLPDLQAGQSEPNLAAAQRYVALLREEQEAQRKRLEPVPPVPTSSPPPPPGVP